MPVETCRQCNRTVVLVKLGDEMVATEREVIQVVPLRRDSNPMGRGDGQGRWRESATTPARQLHAGLCEGYVETARRERIAGEQRAFNRKNRNHGL